MAPDPASALQRLRSRHAGARVLLADADKARCLRLQGVLSLAGLQPQVAHSAAAALDLAGCHFPALLVLAPGLPDGPAPTETDLLCRLRALPNAGPLPWLALVEGPVQRAPHAAAATLHWPAPAELLYATVLPWLAPAPAAPDETLAALQGGDGIDVAAGLDAVGGNPLIYRRLLQVFVNTHGADGPALRQLQQAGDLDALAALAHHLRGAAVTLGLVDIEGAAAALERAAEQSLQRPPADPCLPALTQALDAALAQVLPLLRRALHP